MSAAKPSEFSAGPNSDAEVAEDEGKGDDIDQMLHALAQQQKKFPTPVPTSDPVADEKKRKRRKKSGPPTWALVVLFSASVVLAVGLGLALVVWAS